MTYRLFLAFIFIQVALALDPSKTVTQYTHRVWQQEQGLPQPTVYSICQTHEGYLWLGVQGHLERFDGVRFTEYDGSPGARFGNSPVRALIEDNHHNLWIGSSGGGLTRLSGGVFTRLSGLPDDNVTSLASDGHGNLWIGTYGGLVKLAGGHFTVYTTAQGLPTNRIRAIAIGRDGAPWVAGEDFGVAHWNGAHFERILSEPAGVHAVLSAGDGSIWVGTEQGLLRRRNGRIDSWTVAQGLPDNSILSLAEGSDGSVWIGTTSGLSRWKDGEFANYEALDGLSHSTVLSLFCDRESNLWAGTKNGLNQFLDGKVTPYTTREGLPSNDIGPVYEDRSGHLWVGTRDAGLARFDGRRFHVLTREHGLTGNAISSLGEDSAGDLWVGTSAGLNRLHNGRVSATFTTRQGLPSDQIESIFLDSHNRLWIATVRGLGWMEKGRFIAAPPSSGLAGKKVLSLGGGTRVELFAATADGDVTYLKDGQFGRIDLSRARLPQASSFLAAPDHILWVGTLGGGLRRCQDRKVISYSVRDGLFDDEIYATILDDENNLWMASSKGIFRTPLQDLEAFAAGKSKTVASYPLSTGEVRFECRPGAQPVVAKTHDGRLWFSTDNGLILVDPYRLRRDAQPPPILIRDVMVNNRPAESSELLSLRPRENNLQFLFASLSFIAPERVTFRYYLEGYDKGWSEPRNSRVASYTNLPPGHFRFHVTACSADGICNSTSAAAGLYIVPYFYQRRWFYPVLAAFLALLVWLAYQLRIRRMENQFTLVLAERTRIARELHDTLLQGLSSITMQMQGLSNRMPSSALKLTLDDIIHDAGTCLKEARKSLWGLRSPSSSATELPERVRALARRITEGHPIHLELDLPRDLGMVPAEIESHLVSITQEALLNSVLHGGPSTIELALRPLPGQIRLTIADDGRGFPAQAPPPPGHYGLLGIRERVAELGGDFEIDSEPGKGTRLRVTVPVPKSPARGPDKAHADHQSSLR